MLCHRVGILLFDPPANRILKKKLARRLPSIRFPSGFMYVCV